MCRLSQIHHIALLNRVTQFTLVQSGVTPPNIVGMANVTAWLANLKLLSTPMYCYIIYFSLVQAKKVNSSWPLILYRITTLLSNFGNSDNFCSIQFIPFWLPYWWTNWQLYQKKNIARVNFFKLKLTNMEQRTYLSFSQVMMAPLVLFLAALATSGTW